MIDVESLIFSQVAEALRVAFPGIFVSGEYVDTPAKFPAVTIVESDNTIVQRMRTANIENAATLMSATRSPRQKTLWKPLMANFPNWDLRGQCAILFQT